MMKYYASLAILTALTIGGPDAHATARVSLRVAPSISLAPASLKIEARVEPNDENRLLSVEVDSLSYWRSSEFLLDGRNGQRVSQLIVKGLPSGSYEVRAVLVGRGGPIETAVQLVEVEPGAGAP
jgi:hypothetical protein